MRARVACCLWEHFRGSGCAGEGEAARGDGWEGGWEVGGSGAAGGDISHSVPRE